MSYLQAVIMAFLGALGASIFNFIVSASKRRRECEEELKSRLNLTEDGVKSLLRTEIQKEYVKIFKRGFTREYEKNNVSYLYKSYRNLGGNSYISKLYDQIMELPIDNKED